MATYHQAYTYIFNELIKKDDETTQYKIPNNGVAWNTDTLELWWDTPVNTQPKTKHNKPDLIVWRTEEKLYYRRCLYTTRPEYKSK